MTKKVDEMIERVLKTAPEFELRNDFSQKVVKAIRKKELINQRKLYFWMVLGFVVILGFGYGLMKMYMPASLVNSNVFDLGDQFNRSVPFAIILSILIIGIQYLDKKLIKDKYLFN